MDDRSKTFASLENVLHEIMDKPEVHDRGGNESEENSIDSTFTSVDSVEGIPFQEILDLALEYIERVPPMHIQRLAARFYGAEEIRLLTSRVKEISMFESAAPNEGLPRSTSLDPLAGVALGYGHLLDKKRFRRSRLNYRLLQFVAVFVFASTVLSVYQSLLCKLPSPRTQTDSERVDALSLPLDSACSQTLKILVTPTVPPIHAVPPPPMLPSHLTELLNSASRLVVDNAVSTYVRSCASEMVTATWTNVMSSVMESESLLDLDAALKPDRLPANSDPLCLPPTSELNTTWADLLLNTASMTAVKSPVSMYVRANVGEVAATTWNVTAKIVSRVLESQPLRDFDSSVETDPTTDHFSAKLISNTRSNPCLENATWVNLLLSSRGSLSLSYCLASMSAQGDRAG
jgi:hypothetical protein